MLGELFFAIGLVNCVFLTGIFVIRGTRGVAPLRRIGPLYLLLAIPAVLGIYLVAREQKAWEYAFFLDMEGHEKDEAVAAALADLAAVASSVKLLGSYPKAEEIER